MRRKKAMKDKQKERGKLPYSNSPLKREVRKFPTRVAMMRGIVERCLCLLSSAALGYWDSLEHHADEGIVILPTFFAAFNKEYNQSNFLHLRPFA